MLLLCCIERSLWVYISDRLSYTPEKGQKLGEQLWGQEQPHQRSRGRFVGLLPKRPVENFGQVGSAGALAPF